MLGVIFCYFFIGVIFYYKHYFIIKTVIVVVIKPSMITSNQDMGSPRGPHIGQNFWKYCRKWYSLILKETDILLVGGGWGYTVRTV